MNFKYILFFEFSKVIVALFNFLFLAENFPEISIIISLVSIFTSSVAVGVAAVAGAAVAGAAAVTAAADNPDNFQESKGGTD